MADCRLAHHTAKKIARRTVGDQGFGEGNESEVHVVRRHCCGDAVDAGRRQGRASGRELHCAPFYRQLIVRTAPALEAEQIRSLDEDLPAVVEHQLRARRDGVVRIARAARQSIA